MKIQPLHRRRVIYLLFFSLIGIMLFVVARWVDAQKTFRLTDQPVPVPLLTTVPGIYTDDTAVYLASPSIPDAQIIFSLDGSLPQPGQSPVYEQPIALRADAPGMTVIRARTLLPDGRISDPITASYLVGMETSLPVLSLVVEPDDLWGEQGIYEHEEMSGAEWERPSVVSLFDENGRLAFTEAAGVRIHGQASRLFDKKSFRLYFRGEYGSRRLNYPLFAGNPVTSFDDLVIHSGGQDSYAFSANWTLLRTQLMSHLAREVDAYSTYNQPVLLFLNGDLWGIYNLRERMDETYFQDRYGLQGVEIVDSLFRNEDRTEAANEWRALVEFADANDLADPEKYAVVASQLDVDNMIDHYILQMYAANTDWPHNNERVFRADDGLGRWHWALWDVDYAFGLSPSSFVEVDMVRWLMAPDRPEVEFYGRLFRAMMDNPEFRNQFLVRSADLLNTTLQPDTVQAQIDTLAAELRPDIGYEVARWSSPGNWEQSVLDLSAFVQQRPALMWQHYVDGFGLAGTAVLTINDSEGGSVLLNERWIPERPYTGTYFQDTTLQLRAVPDAGYRLAGWLVDAERVTDTEIFQHTITHNSTITPEFVRDDGQTVGLASFTDYALDGWQTGVICTENGTWLKFELHESVDLRGWRLTDNDAPDSSAEGSLVFADVPELADVPGGATITIVLPETAVGNPPDDLQTNLLDREMTLYSTNPNLDSMQDVGFRPVTGDSLVLLNNANEAVAMMTVGSEADLVLAARFGLGETAVSVLDAHYCP